MAGTGAGPGLREAGEQSVDVPVICVITRFGLRSAWHLLPTYLDFRRVVRQARRSATPGLLRAAFLVEGPRTCYSLSVWTELNAIPKFGGTVPSHVDAARRVIGRVAFTPGRGPELWSTKWKLAAVSNNLNWSEFDLRGVLQSTAYADVRSG